MSTTGVSGNIHKVLMPEIFDLFLLTCDDCVLGLDDLLAAVDQVNLDGVRVGKATMALDIRDFVLLEEAFDTLGQACNVATHVK